MTDIDLMSEIKKLNEAWMRDFSSEDAQTVGAHYTEDAISLPPHMKAVIGKAAITEYWAKSMQSGVGALNIRSKEVERAGDRVIEIGETELIGMDSEVIDRFNYMVIWKKAGDAWLIHREIWNSVM